MKKVILCALTLLIIITGTMTACTQKQTYIVSFFNGNELFYSATVEYGEKVSFPNRNPTKESDEDYDYIFVGWKDNSLGIVSEEDMRAYGDINLYAVFDAKAKSKDKIYFTVTFIDDLTNEQIGDKQQVEDGGDAVLPTAPDHSDEGYTFDGWSASHKNIKHTSTIRALYVKSEQSIFTLTRHYLGQTRSDSYSAGSEIPLDEPTINSAFVFEGWYFDEDFTEPATGVIDGDLDIYAKISIDFSSAELNASADMIYGENNVVTIAGLKGENIIDYSYKWLNGESGNSRTLINAGAYELSVEITATYTYNDEVIITATKELTGSFTVEKATLSVTLDTPNNSVTYGISPLVTTTMEGFKYDDNVESLSLPLTLKYLRAESKQGSLTEFNGDTTKLPVGYYTVSAQMDELENYKMDEASQPISFSVTPKEIIIDFTTNNYSYGDELGGDNPIAQLVYEQSDFVYGETVSVLGTPIFTITNASYSKNYPNLLNAGSYNVALSGLSSNNYSIQYAKSNATLRIAQKAASVNVNASDWTYGQDAQYSFSVTGVLANDESSLDFKYEFTKNGLPYVNNGERLGAGDYTVQVSYKNNSNYAFADNEPISFTVNKADLSAELTFTNATKQNGAWSIVYGTAPEYTIDYNGFVDNDKDILTGLVSVLYYGASGQANASQLSAATYSVRVEGLSNLENYNYDANDVATIVVAKKAFTITVSLSHEETSAYVYGETKDGLTEKFGYVLDEFAYNDTIGSVFGSLTITLKNSNGNSVVDTLPSVGNYYATIDSIGAPTNYNVTVIPFDFIINKAVLDIGLENFDGDSVELNYGERPSAQLTVSGFKGSDRAQAAPSLVYIGSTQKFTNSSKFTVGNYSLKVEWADESVLNNYEWKQLTNTLKINPKDIALTFNVASSYVYGSEVDLSHSFNGFVYGETEQDVFPLLNVSVSKGNAEYVPSKYFEVGNYTAKISELNNPNYNITNIEAAQVNFAVTKQRFAIEDTTRASRLDAWTFTPKFRSEFVFNGTLWLNTTNAGIYVWNDSEHDELIAWQNGYSITLDGENVTDNFELYYNISVELLKSEFKFSVPNHAEFTYDGNEHKFTVSVKEDEGTLVKVEYGVGDKSYGLDEPVFINAGNYVVYYRLSAENYETEEGSFTVTGNKNTTNVITAALESDAYTYDGQERAYDIYATATFGAVTVTMNRISVTATQYLSNAGTYVFTFTVADTDNYVGCELVRTIKIDKADYEVIGASNQNYTFNAEEQGNDVIVLDVNGRNVTNSVLNVSTNDGKIKFIDALTYTVSWFIEESANYNEKSGSYTVTIDKFTLSVSKENQNYVYDSLVHGKGVSVNKSPDNEYSVQYSLKSSLAGTADLQDSLFEFVNADTYTVYYRVTGANYNDVTGSYTIVITPKTVTVIGLPNGNLNSEYNEEGFRLPKLSLIGLEDADKDFVGFAYSIKINNVATEQIINKGVYTVTYTLSAIGGSNEALHKNYVLDSGLASGNFTVTITAMNVTLDTSAIITEYDYNGKEQTVDLTKVKIFAGGKQLTIEELQAKDSSIKLEFTTTTGAINGGQFSFINVKDADGTKLTIKLTANANSNYGSASAYVDITVNRIEYTKALPEIEVEKQIMRIGKTLSEISLAHVDGYSWFDTDTLLKIGLQSYAAVYEDPSGNYLPKNTTIAILAEKQDVNVKLTEEVDFTNDLSDAALAVTFTKGSDKLTTEELKYIKVEKLHNIDFTVGSTYKLTYVISLLTIDGVDAADYFDLIFDKEGRSDSVYEYSTYFKIKSVEVSGKLYTIEDALKIANSGTVTVKYNTSFASSDIQTVLYSDESYRTLKEGVILLLPYDGTNYKNTIEHTNKTDWSRSTFGDPNYLKLNLTLPSGVTLINNGTILVGGMTSSGNGGSNPAGQTASYYAQITLGQDSSIESNGNIEAYGFIVEESKNNGSAVNMHSGALTMPFVVIEHRGGTVFSQMYLGGLKGAPFNRFYMQNVTPTLTIDYNAKLIGYANLYANSKDNPSNISLIGNGSDKETYMFTLQNNANIKAKYDISTKITKLDIYGDMTLNPLSIKLGTMNVETSKTMFPVSWYYNIALNPLTANGTATVNASAQDIKILPGGSITIARGVTVTINSLFVADSTYMDAGLEAPKYDANKGEGKLIVNGTLNATNLGGYVQTESDGATLSVSKSASVTTYEVKAKGLFTASWDSFTQTLNGKIYSDSGVSAPTTMTTGSYTSKSGGWIKN